MGSARSPSPPPSSAGLVSCRSSEAPSGSPSLMSPDFPCSTIEEPPSAMATAASKLCSTTLLTSSASSSAPSTAGQPPPPPQINPSSAISILSGTSSTNTARFSFCSVYSGHNNIGTPALTATYLVVGGFPIEQHRHHVGRREWQQAREIEERVPHVLEAHGGRASIFNGGRRLEEERRGRDEAEDAVDVGVAEAEAVQQQEADHFFTYNRNRKRSPQSPVRKFPCSTMRFLRYKFLGACAFSSSSSPITNNNDESPGLSFIHSDASQPPLLSDCLRPTSHFITLTLFKLVLLHLIDFVLPHFSKGGIVALWKFDALHIGHRELAIQAAKIGVPFLLSFVGMAEILGWEPRPPVVAKCDRKRILSSWAPLCPNITPKEFHIQFSKVRYLSPCQFVEKLSDELGVGGVVAGQHYRFGYKAAADSSDLVRLCDEYGMKASIVDSVMDKKQEFFKEIGRHHNGTINEQGQVSSTRVRLALADGDMNYVSQLLGRNHRLMMMVKKEENVLRDGKKLSACRSCLLNLPPKEGFYNNCSLVIGENESVVPCRDTITGFLLAGVGNVDLRRKTNYLIVDSKSTVNQIEDAFKEFTTREDIAVLLISQFVANMIRFLVDNYNKPIPAILEIPSKDHPYDPAHDSVLSRVKYLFSTESVASGRLFPTFNLSKKCSAPNQRLTSPAKDARDFIWRTLPHLRSCGCSHRYRFQYFFYKCDLVACLRHFVFGFRVRILGPKDLPVIARTAGRLAGRAIGYVQVTRGQFESVMQQSQARQVHKELQDTMAQLEAIRHEIRSISFMNPGPLTTRLVDNIAGQPPVTNGIYLC
ncbi:v-type proton ATPase subunit F [Striga asiatica]|uniref:FAD synthase n=1 Tax=Striga asiatica TaxID=4170 RepID=A0A5A7NWJ7_STRAF|nr:v-type proton ATPase subunit F [Striga asiatica]